MQNNRVDIIKHIGLKTRCESAEAVHTEADTKPSHSQVSSKKVSYLGEHLLGGKSFDVSDSSGCSLFELDSLEYLMHVKSVISAGRLHLFVLTVTTHLFVQLV